MSRSSRPETRNPLLKLPAAQRLAALTGEPRAALRELLLQLGREANEKASLCWRTHKAPMAAYWKAAAVYARHIARLIGREDPPAADGVVDVERTLREAQGYVQQFMVDRAREWRAEHGETRPDGDPRWVRAFEVNKRVNAAVAQLGRKEVARG